MIKQNPFSVYDFLGYLIPGSIIIYAYLIIDYLKGNTSFKLSEFIDTFQDLELEGIFFFVIISYTLGHLVSFASSITIEKYANWRYSYPSKYLLDIEHKGFWLDCNNFKDNVWRFMMIIFLLPCVCFDWVFGKLLGLEKFYKKSLDDLLKKMIKLKVISLLNKIGNRNLVHSEFFLDGTANRCDFHRIITHYAYENSKNHQSKMTNYVALYGFLRTLSLIFNLLSIYFFYRVYCFSEFTSINFLILFIISSLSYLSFVAFMKFYRRYTLEGLMIIVIDEEI